VPRAPQKILVFEAVTSFQQQAPCVGRLLADADEQQYQHRNDAAATQSARLIRRQEPNHGLALAVLATILVKYGRGRPAALDYAQIALAAAPAPVLAHCAAGMACRDLGLLHQASRTCGRR
jgi:protein tyrosine phosphatase (PTP) superfamily phosphohydrolase (DUF442 family)